MILRQSYRVTTESASRLRSADAVGAEIRIVGDDFPGGNYFPQSEDYLHVDRASAPPLPIQLSAVPDCDEYLAQEPQEPGYWLTIAVVVGFYVLAYLIYLLCKFIRHEVPIAMDAAGRWIQLLRSGR